MTNYQTEIQKLNNLLNGLEEKVNLEPAIGLGVHPPLWSGDIKDLEKFANELQEWLDEPKLKEVKDIIKEFQGICNDKRKFQFDANKGYYISLGKILPYGKNILYEIDNDIIKKRASQAILNEVFQQKGENELKAEINKIKEFWDLFNEKIINFDTKKDSFIENVKNEYSENVIKSLKNGFNNEEITNGYLKMEKARRSRESLKEIDSNVFLGEYEITKDIDSIWNVSEEIRRNLDHTNVNITGIAKGSLRKIFSELLNYIKNRNTALKEKNLSAVKKELEGISENLNKWSVKVNKFIDDDITQLGSWISAIESSKGDLQEIDQMTTEIQVLIQKFDSLKFDEIKQIKTKELYDTFEEYYLLKGKIDDFFRNLLSEDARKILENLTNLQKIKSEMDEKFWVSVEELCNVFPELRIKLDWNR